MQEDLTVKTAVLTAKSDIYVDLKKSEFDALDTSEDFGQGFRNGLKPFLGKTRGDLTPHMETPKEGSDDWVEVATQTDMTTA